MRNPLHALAAAALAVSMLIPFTPVRAEDTVPSPSPSPTAESAPTESTDSTAAPDALIVEESAAPSADETVAPTEAPQESAESTNAPKDSANPESAAEPTALNATAAPTASADPEPAPSEASGAERLVEVSAPSAAPVAALAKAAPVANTSAGEATLTKGDKFNIAVKNLVPGSSVTKAANADTTITAIVRSPSAPEASENTIDISDANDGSILAWFDSSSRTVYWWSGADKVYFNADCYNMFYSFQALKDIELNGFDSSRVNTMTSMFGYCKQLPAIDVSSFDTSNVGMMWRMFEGCENLKEIDLSAFTTESLGLGFGGMFNGCKQLRKVNIQNFDFSAIISAEYGITPVFNGCENLNEITLGKKCMFKTSAPGIADRLMGMGGPTKPDTASGLPSTGKWGLGSETAPWSLSFSALMRDWFPKNPDNLFDLSGTWYVQAESGAIFDANGGEGDMPGERYVADTEQTLTPNRFVRDGYRFVNWNTAKDGSGTPYEDGAVMSLKTPVTLYAQWEKDAPKEYEPSKVEILYTGGAGYGGIKFAGAGLAALAVLMLLRYRR